jgi:hypothetical protein
VPLLRYYYYVVGLFPLPQITNALPFKNNLFSPSGVPTTIIYSGYITEDNHMGKIIK